MEHNTWKAFFIYPKRERRGIFALTIIIIIILLYNILGDFSTLNETDFTNFDKEVANYKIEKEKLLLMEEESKNKSYKTKNTYTSKKKESELKLKYFDPNTATKNDWIEMGLKEDQALSILKYVNKGGSFKKAEDINKIYLLSDYEKKSIEKFIRIPKSKQVESSYTNQEIYIAEEETEQLFLDLNTVNAQELLDIRGIGPATAKAIINYRELLGGFYLLEQLNEIYLIDTARYSQIESHLYVNTNALSTLLKLNTSSYFELKKHPYISKANAYNIVEYRNNNGDFTNTEQLKSVQGINDSIYERIYRYFAPLKQNP